MVCPYSGSGTAEQLDVGHASTIFSAFVGPIDETMSRNSSVEPSGEIMSEGAHSMVQEAPTREGIVLTQSDLETVTNEECETEFARGRAVARPPFVQEKRQPIFRPTIAGAKEK